MALIILISYHRLLSGQNQIGLILLTHTIGIGVILGGEKILVLSHIFLRDYGPTLICILSRGLTIIPILIKISIPMIMIWRPTIVQSLILQLRSLITLHLLSLHGHHFVAYFLHHREAILQLLVLTLQSFIYVQHHRLYHLLDCIHSI